MGKMRNVVNGRPYRLLPVTTNISAMRKTRKEKKEGRFGRASPLVITCSARSQTTFCILPIRYHCIKPIFFTWDWSTVDIRHRCWHCERWHPSLRDYVRSTCHPSTFCPVSVLAAVFVFTKSMMIFFSWSNVLLLMFCWLFVELHVDK